MKDISGELDTHIGQETTSLASFLRIKRTDGKLFHFTTHDVGLYVDIGGLSGTQLYTPVDSYIPSSMTVSDSLDVDEMELTAIMSSGRVSESELGLGLFDYAEVKFFAANWTDVSQGPLKMLKGNFGEVTIRSDGVFVVELRGLSQVLRQKGIVRSIRKDCDADVGDVRCGTPIWNDEVEREKTYAKDDYVRASNVLSYGLIAITTGTNLGFESGDLTGWTTNSGTPLVQSATKGGTSPYEGSEMLTGTDGAGDWEIEQIVTLSQLSDAKVDSGDYMLNVSIRVGSGHGGDTQDDHTVKVEFLTVADALVSTPLDIAAQNMASGNDNWAIVEMINEPIPATTRKVRITLGGVDVADANMSVIFDDVIIGYLDITTTDFVLARATAANPRFEIGGGADGTVGWNEESGDWRSVFPAGPVTALLGNYQMRGVHTGAPGTISQIYDVSDVFSSADIDVGLIKLTAVIWEFTASALNDTFRIEIEALNASGVLLYVIRDTGTITPTIINTWIEYTVEVILEPGVRNVRLSFTSTRDAGGNNIHFDHGFIILEHQDRKPLSEDFDDVIYRCTTAGTTAIAQPVYDSGVGNTTADGTAIFTTEEAWSRAVEVVDVDGTEPRRKFTVTELTPNSGGPRGGFPDDWMNDGGFTFDTGDNIGRTMEIKDFTADDGATIEQVIELQLEMPFDVSVGDKGRCYPGCDKRRQTCNGKFSNFVIVDDPSSGLRHRGFTNLPGQGFMNRAPDFKPSKTEVS